MPPKRVLVRGCGDRFGEEIALLARDRANTPCDDVPRDQRGEVPSSGLRRPEIELFIPIKLLMEWQ